MTFRVSTQDVQFQDALKSFQDDLHRMRQKFEQELLGLKAIRVQINDQEIKDMRTLPVGGVGVPRFIQKEPIEPVTLFSEPEGKGTRYRPEPDGQYIIANSAVCYMFDEFQQAARNVQTGTVSVLPVGFSLQVGDVTLYKESQTQGVVATAEQIAVGQSDTVELPLVDPLTPTWEIPSARIEADKVDHDVRLQRDIFDPPFPQPPETITVSVGVPVYCPGTAYVDPTIQDPQDPLWHREIIGQGTDFIAAGFQPNSTVILGDLPPLTPAPTTLPVVTYQGKIKTVDSPTHMTLWDPFPYVPEQLPKSVPWPGSNYFTPGVSYTTPLGTPWPLPVPVARLVPQDLPLPVPPAAQIQALNNPFNLTDTLSAKPIQEIVTPLTPLLRFQDKTETNYDANIMSPLLGAPPPPSILPGPFGIGKGRLFNPTLPPTPTAPGHIQIEPLQEGPASKPLLRQGPEMALAAVIRPTQPPSGTGYSVASCSSPIPAIPFSTTNYSLQLVEAQGFLFPRLCWQFYDTGVIATGLSSGGAAAIAQGVGAIVTAVTAGASAPVTPETVAKRTAYAQSLVPLPLPVNLQDQYPASAPPPPAGLPHASRYFVGVTRWKRELPLQTIPGTVAPTQPYMGFMPNLEGILQNPALAFESVRYGDYVTLGNDGPVYFTSSYEMWKPYDGSAGSGMPGEPIVGGTILTWPPYYLGNPPTIFPFPKGKKLYSLGVTFYLGDLETGNFVIDEQPLYGTDDFSLMHGGAFIPGVNNNLPFPNTGELSDFYIGADFQSPYYFPSLKLNGHVQQAGIAALMGLGTVDQYGVVAAGHNPTAIPSVLPFPSPIYSGDFYMLSIPASVGNTKQERDAAMLAQFNACFPDYTRVGRTVTRSPRSQIPNGGTVYASYGTDIDLPEAEEDSEVIKATIDRLLNASSNPATDTTDTVADAVGIPPPRANNNDTEKDLEPYGIHVVDGRPYLPGDTPVEGFKGLVDVLGYPGAVDAAVGKPNGPLLVISIEERQEADSVDSCGNLFTRVLVTERILGIDISTQEALRIAGVADPGLLILRLWWLGGLQLPTLDVQNKLNSYQLDPIDKTAALLGESNGTIEVFEIPDQNIVQKLAGTGSEIEKLFTDRNPVTINVSPTSVEVRLALSDILTAPPASTSDGRLGVVSPFLGLFRTLDLAKAFGLTSAELADLGVQLGNELDDLCRALYQGTASCVQSADLSVVAYRNALAPALELLNFNVGTARQNLETYIPCLGNFTLSMAVPPDITLTFPVPPFPPPPPPAIPAPPPPPTPRELLDRLRDDVEQVATMAEKALDSLGPIRVLRSQLPVIGTAVAAVSSEADRILCVPRSMVEALEGGVCGIAIPPDVVKACVEGNEKFKTLLGSVKDYCFVASLIINQALNQFLQLKDVIDDAATRDTLLATEIEGCLQQISGFVSQITLMARSPATQAALDLTRGGI